jgi:hypothetical protein
MDQTLSTKRSFVSVLPASRRILLTFETNRMSMEVTLKKLLIALAVLPFLAGAVSAALPVPPGGPPTGTPPNPSPVACPVPIEYVLGTDHNLWREYSDRSTERNIHDRLQVDQDVAQFQAHWCSNVVYVLKTDGTLWRAAPIPNWTNPKKIYGDVKIDADVLQFQIMGDDTAYVLKKDGSLWREQPNQSPQRVDENVVQFQAVDYNVALSGVNSVVTDMYVLDSQENLRQDGKLLDQNVLHFQVDTHGNVFVLYTNNRLYRRYPGGRHLVDWTVLAFQALDETTVYVLRTDGNLYKTGNPNAVGQGVLSFQVLAPASVDILWADRTLSNNLESYHIDANVLGFQNFQAPFQAAGLQLLDISKCPRDKEVTQSTSVYPSPPCIFSTPDDNGTLDEVQWTIYPLEVNCDHLWNVCTWEFYTSDYDKYEIKYGHGTDTSNWPKITAGKHQSITHLPNLQPGAPYGVIIRGSTFSDLSSDEWTSWSGITPFTAPIP